MVVSSSSIVFEISGTPSDGQGTPSDIEGEVVNVRYSCVGGGYVGTGNTCVRFYQVRYRDAVGVCVLASTNSTNGVAAIWSL